MDRMVCCPRCLSGKLRGPWNHMLKAAAVAYQFAKIGNDKVAQDLVQNLGDDKLLGKYIDCMGTFSGRDGHQLFVYVSC